MFKSRENNISPTGAQQFKCSFSSEIMEARKNWLNIFKGKNFLQE